MAATNTGNPGETPFTKTSQALGTYQSTNSDLNSDDEQVEMVTATLLELVVLAIDDDTRDVLVEEDQDHTDHCGNDSGKPSK